MGTQLLAITGCAGPRVARVDPSVLFLEPWLQCRNRLCAWASLGIWVHKAVGALILNDAASFVKGGKDCLPAGELIEVNLETLQVSELIKGCLYESRAAFHTLRSAAFLPVSRTSANVVGIVATISVYGWTDHETTDVACDQRPAMVKVWTQRL
jgi:hypothetical protein